MSPERELDGFIDKYSPEVATLARAALARLRRRLPGAIVLVYDNYNALAIGFAPTEKAGDAVFSIALYPRWVNLFFLKGKGLPDPEGLLRGSGNVVRSIVLEDAKTLERPAVRELMRVAFERSPKRFGPRSEGRLVIRAISAKQRPRRVVARPPKR